MLLATTKVYDKCQAPVGWLGLVIAVGTLAAAQFLDSAVLSEIVGRLHRVERAGRAFDLVVLPHPSGRSTWLNREENARLFRRSLKLIRGMRRGGGRLGRKLPVARRASRSGYPASLRPVSGTGFKVGS